MRPVRSRTQQRGSFFMKQTVILGGVLAAMLLTPAAAHERAIGADALGGAARGAIIGGIAGDAGKGAAAGAVGGALSGDVARPGQGGFNGKLPLQPYSGKAKSGFGLDLGGQELVLKGVPSSE